MAARGPLLLCVVTMFVCACDDLKLESTAFECETDDDCLSGFACLPSTAEPGVNICKATDTSADATTDGGSDGASCSSECTYPRGIGECQNGVCALVGCESGYADCDSDGFNGCEVNVLTNSAHCNGCNAACTSGSTCVSGSCTTETPKTCTNFFNTTQCGLDEQCVPVDDSTFQCAKHGTKGDGDSCVNPIECGRGLLCVGGVCDTIDCTPQSNTMPCSGGQICAPIGAQSKVDVGVCIDEPIGQSCNSTEQSRVCTLLPNYFCTGFVGLDDLTLCTRRCDAPNEPCPFNEVKNFCGNFGDGAGGSAGLCLSAGSCAGILSCISIVCQGFDPFCVTSNCSVQGDNEADALFGPLSSCALANACLENQCLIDNCSAELDACNADLAAGD